MIYLWPQLEEGQNFMAKYLIINGPNLNKLGVRQPEIYGKLSLDQIKKYTEEKIQEMGITLEWYQSNIEGEIIDKIQSVIDSDFDGLIINPAAYSHTSIGIYDALEMIGIPIIEIHLSNVYKRQSFRQTMLTAGAADIIMCGLGVDAYHTAVYSLQKRGE